MNDQTRKRLDEHETLFVRLPGWKPNTLKKKLRTGKNWTSRQHTCNHGGGHGRASRRLPGWQKHAKGPQNVSR